MKLDLEQFSATRSFYTPDEYARENRGELAPNEVGAFVYTGGLVITILKDGRFSLILGNQDWVTYDLGGCEERLYEYADQEGGLEVPDEPKESVEEVRKRLLKLIRQMLAEGVSEQTLYDNGITRDELRDAKLGR